MRSTSARSPTASAIGETSSSSASVATCSRFKRSLDRFCQVSRHRPWLTRAGLAIWPALMAGWMGMRCVECGSKTVTERPERTAQGYRRFRCRACGKQFNERTGGLLNRTQYPSDVVALVVLWRLRYKLALRDLPEMFLVRGIVFSHEAVREWEAKLTPALAEDLRRRRRGKAGRSWYVDETYLKVQGRWCYLYRAIDRSGALVDVLFSEHRDMAAAQAFFHSAKAVTGVTPDRVTTDGHDSYPRAIRTTLGKGVRHRTSRYLNNRLEAATGPCGASSAPDRPPGSVGLTTNCATSSARAPAITSTFPPIAGDCSTSGGPRPCWPSCKPHDGMSPYVREHRRYFLARALTEPYKGLVQHLPERNLALAGKGVTGR